MNEFVLVLIIASVAALLTFPGAPLAERFEVPHRVVSAALQFAAGMIPEANRVGEPSFTGILYMGGLSLYGLMSLAVR